MTQPPPHAPEPLDIREKGAGGAISERRLYLQLQTFTGVDRTDDAVAAFRQSGLEGAVYLDVNDPRGLAILVIAEDPATFTGRARQVLTSGPFAPLVRHCAMTGRTYSSGREEALDWWLLRKPREVALNPAWPWAVWYPLRRKPEFALLEPKEQGKILYEHAQIGMQYGEADLAHDVRLACHGLDRDDNEFIIGLCGRELYPLSRIVQDMRRTQQTAKFIQSLGPFFVGRAAWQSPLSS
jgi:chlorite dismutase